MKLVFALLVVVALVDDVKEHRVGQYFHLAQVVVGVVGVFVASGVYPG